MKDTPPNTYEVGYEAGPAQPQPQLQPGLVVLLALIIAGAVLLACSSSSWLAWL